MKYLAIALATAALGLSGTALAGPAKDTATLAKAPKLMTDAQMDSVVAGGSVTVSLYGVSLRTIDTNSPYSGSFNVTGVPGGQPQLDTCQGSLPNGIQAMC